MSDRAAPGPRLRRIGRYRLLLVLALVVCALDQLTKVLVAARLPFNAPGASGRIEVVPGFFNLIHVGNTGAAWSMFDGHSEILAALALVTLGAIYVFRRHLWLEVRSVQIAFGLLCGGAVGNVIDRLQHGHVIDFLDFHFGSYVYPTFNVADSCIVCGVILYVLLSLRAPKTQTG